MDSKIPAGPDQITDGWLTSVLRATAIPQHTRVTAHQTELVEQQGAAAIVAKIALDYDAAEESTPRTLIAKFAAEHEPIRRLQHALGGYLREVEFYRQFGTEAGIPTPRCYHADIDRASGAFVLLLEDMSNSRTAEGPILAPEDIELAVRHLAPFHATWWNHERLRGAEFLRFPGSPADEAFLAMARGALAAALPASRARFGDGLPPALVDVVEHLLANFDALVAFRRENHDTATLVHGDYHPGQIFFPSETGGRFAVFDWQTVSAGNGGDDLARIIVTGLDAEQRRASDERLIDLYHALLVEHGVKGYNRELCQRDFRLGLMMSVAINVIAGASIDPAFIQEYEETAGALATDAFFGWLADAVEAHDVLSVMPT